MEQTVNLPAYAYVGSNPTPTTGRAARANFELGRLNFELGQQSLNIAVPGAVAQLGERLNGIQEVRGSIPLGSTAGEVKLVAGRGSAR
jgi:hypothetical protein